jgi:uncharacterized protein with ParB-like and HNH nuclease domain
MSNVNNSQLDYKPLQVVDLFHSTSYYTVPSYQRGYSWTSEEIQELLLDLDDAYRSFPEEEYLLGQIIVCPSNTKNLNLPRDVIQWELIDGQQRCTTLYLFLLRSLNKVEVDLESKALELSLAEKGKLAEWSPLKQVINLQDQVMPRIKAASNGGSLLESLLENKLLENFEGPTQTNMMNAIDEIDAALSKLSPKEAFEFLRFVLNQVWVVRLGLNTAEHALRVFQKVNNRGLQLDDADLIKSYLFQSVKTDEAYQLLAKHWESATLELSKAKNKRLKPMENLMKLLIGIRTGKSISKGSLYDTWVKELKTEDKVSELALNLKSDASNLVVISQGKIPSDFQKSDLIQGTMDAGWIQPFEILLAGAHLEPESYKNLLKLVEDRTMLSYWSKEKNNSFEAIIHPWAKEVKELDPFASFDEIRHASAKATEDLQDLIRRSFLGIQGLSYSVKSHRPRIRYILARVHNAFQAQLAVNPESIENLMRTPSQGESGFHIDHLFPQSETKRDLWKKDANKDIELGGASRYSQSIHSIGNLVLLHFEDNIKQSDCLPWDDEKTQNLAKSELVLNRVLVDSSHLQQDERISKILVKYQAKRNVKLTLDQPSEVLADQLAHLYWDILSEEIKKNFGLGLES